MANTLTAERLRSLLSYDAATGEFRWMQASGGRQAGAVAGTRMKRGYIRIGIDGKYFLAHRLAWLHVHGEWPSGIIDHRDGHRDANAIGNLRDTTQQVNQQNQRGASRRSSTGLLGASRDGEVFGSMIRTADGARKRLGRFASAEAAHAAYVEAKRAAHEGCTI